MSEYDKGRNQGWAQPGNYEQQQGVWDAQREQRRAQEAEAAAARERDRNYLTSMTTSAQPSTKEYSSSIHSPAGPYTPAPFKQIVSRTAMLALVCTALVWFLLLDRSAGPDLIGVLVSGYFGGAAIGAGLWSLGWAFHFVGIVLRMVLKFTIAAGLLLALFYLLTGRLPF